MSPGSLSAPCSPQCFCCFLCWIPIGTRIVLRPVIKWLCRGIVQKVVKRRQYSFLIFCAKWELSDGRFGNCRRAFVKTTCLCNYYSLSSLGFILTHGCTTRVFSSLSIYFTGVTSSSFCFMCLSIKIISWLLCHPKTITSILPGALGVTVLTSDYFFMQMIT